MAPKQKGLKRKTWQNGIIKCRIPRNEGDRTQKRRDRSGSDLRGSSEGSGAEGQRYFEEKCSFPTFCSVLQGKIPQDLTGEYFGRLERGWNVGQC